MSGSYGKTKLDFMIEGKTVLGDPSSDNGIRHGEENRSEFFEEECFVENFTHQFIEVQASALLDGVGSGRTASVKL